MSSMWAPDNAKELHNARQTPRKTPFADQHAKARDQGFYAPDSVGGGPGSTNGRRGKSNPGRSRGPGSMDGFPRDLGGRATGRGRSRAPPFPQHDQGPPPALMHQVTSTRGPRRKSSREREAVYKSIWGDDSDEEEEKDKDEGKDAEEKGKDAKDGKETQELAQKLDQVKIAPSPAPAPPATVLPPPPVITGADWSELTDDEDLTFLEDVPVPVTAPASVHENDSADDTPGPSRNMNSHSGLDVTTATDIDHSVRRGSPRVNVGKQTSDKEAVDVKLADQLPARPVNPEQVQTSSDIGSEGESTTSAGDRNAACTPATSANAPANNARPPAAPLQNSRWASAPRGMGNRGARGGRPPNNFQQGNFQHNNLPHNNLQHMPPQHRNQPPQNFPRPPPHFNRPPPSGPRANHMQGQERPRPNHMQGLEQAPRGTGSRNAPPMQQRGVQAPAPTPVSASASESDRSSPFPPSTTSETSASADDSPLSGDTQKRGPRQAAVPRDVMKRFMRGWIDTEPAGMRTGTSGRGRARAPLRGGEQGPAPAQEETK